MALTLAKPTGPNPDHDAGSKKRRYRIATFPASYTTGGEALAASDIGAGLKGIHHINATPALNSAGAGDSTKSVQVRWNQGTNKLQAFWQTDPGATGGAAIPFPEVTSTTDLSTYRTHLEIVGY